MKQAFIKGRKQQTYGKTFHMKINKKYNINRYIFVKIMIMNFKMSE